LIARELVSSDTRVITLPDLAAEYPALAEAAKTVVVMPASRMASEMKRIAREYERQGGRLLTEEEVAKEIAERRGAA
jgi:hypothetical protein